MELNLGNTVFVLDLSFKNFIFSYWVQIITTVLPFLSKSFSLFRRYRRQNYSFFICDFVMVSVTLLVLYSVEAQYLLLGWFISRYYLRKSVDDLSYSNPNLIKYKNSSIWVGPRARYTLGIQRLRKDLREGAPHGGEITQLPHRICPIDI